MKYRQHIFLPSVVLVATLWLLAGEPSRADAEPPSTSSTDYNRDIRPILADKCFSCHGPDARSLKGKLRLDQSASATLPAKSGKLAIVPGKPGSSELVKRIESSDEDERMPPTESRKALTAAEITTLKQWISQGAQYKGHWSYLSPQRPTPPVAADVRWNGGAIDRFVFAALSRREMAPAPEADRRTLIRRVSLDLVGLPPMPADVDAFVADTSVDAYERMVDRVLASQRFGERMALLWLDLARYGDTNGYHNDSDRPAWVWRDWVIDAYNRNMPFDQFTIWQLAGDLLPAATQEQKIASGFNRNVRFNEEGGADPEEFLANYAADRAVTMGRIWLGLTLNCAQCHDHKYDPVTQKEFYQLTAFFNSLEEVGAGGVSGFHGKPVPPVIRVMTPRMADDLRQVQLRVEDADRRATQAIAAGNYLDPGFSGDPAPAQAVSQAAWEAQIAANKPAPPPVATAHWDFTKSEKDLAGDRDISLAGGAKLTADGLVLDGKAAYATTAPLKTELRAKTLEATVRLNNLSQSGGAVIGIQTRGDSSAIVFDSIVFAEREPGRWMAGSDHFKRTENFGGDKETDAQKQFVHMVIAYDEDGTIRCYRNGVPYGKPYKKPGPFTFKAGEASVVLGARALPPGSNFMLAGVIRSAKLYDRALSAQEIAAAAGATSLGVPDQALVAIRTEATKRTEPQQALLRDYYLRNVHGATKAKLDALAKESQTDRQRLATLANEANHPLQLVSVEMASPRPAYLLMRGDFQTRGEQVDRSVPGFLPPLASTEPRNRLGLARWLMQADQPLVARVQVNRFWQMLFGEGLVRSSDFGVQGAYPTHPDLLDWLALEFIESKWDVKRMLKLMVMSQTYRQSSGDAQRYADRDARNTLLWRVPRLRLQAELVRDNALAIAGLLSDRVGGPPVFPYQPADFYRGKANGWRWDLSKGEDLYRRGMYTFWRRTTPYPSFVIFDAPDRAECVVDRPRTNTPLQALVTLNDPQFVEAARVFAQRILLEAPADTDARLTFAYRLALARAPSTRELPIMRDFVKGQLETYRADANAAKALISAGASPRPATLDVTEHAAWTAAANVILNLDETITRN